jgi:uncharacterized protein GlcG (DUF336 family)
MTTDSGRPGVEIAQQMLAAGIQASQKSHVEMTIAIVDAGGHIIAKMRMDGASVISGKVAEDKAYTAAVVGVATADLADPVQPGAPLFGLTSADGGRIIAFGGGFPLRTSNGALVGGIGVSGGAVEEDVAVAQAVLDVWTRHTQAPDEE